MKGRAKGKFLPNHLGVIKERMYSFYVYCNFNQWARKGNFVATVLLKCMKCGKVTEEYSFCEILYLAIDAAAIYYSAVIRYFSITQGKRLRLLII